MKEGETGAFLFYYAVKAEIEVEINFVLLTTFDVKDAGTFISIHHDHNNTPENALRGSASGPVSITNQAVYMPNLSNNRLYGWWTGIKEIEKEKPLLKRRDAAADDLLMCETAVQIVVETRLGEIQIILLIALMPGELLPHRIAGIPGTSGSPAGLDLLPNGCLSWRAVTLPQRGRVRLVNLPNTPVPKNRPETS